MSLIDVMTFTDLDLDYNHVNMMILFCDTGGCQSWVCMSAKYYHYVNVSNQCMYVTENHHPCKNLIIYQPNHPVKNIIICMIMTGRSDGVVVVLDTILTTGAISKRDHPISQLVWF